MDDLVNYLALQWVRIQDGVLTIGLNEEGVEELGDTFKVNLPEENDEVSAGQAFGEIDTQEGPVNLHCPVDGVVTEVNQAVVENPLLLKEDHEDAWLIRVEAEDPDNIEF